MTKPDLRALFVEFLKTYDAAEKDRVWRDLSNTFRSFWSNRVLSRTGEPIADDECDPIIRILDRNGKGNTKESEAVARAMIPQGAWRRLFKELQSNHSLANHLNSIFVTEMASEREQLINELYRMNEGKKNHLTGQSGNAVNAFLAAHDPVRNTFVISLKDRKTLMDFLGLQLEGGWESNPIGSKIVLSNIGLTTGLRELGLDASARTLSRFFYQTLKPHWKADSRINRVDKSVSVTVPEGTSEEESSAPVEEEIRQSMKVQAMLATIGAKMGFAIWLPRADRGRVTKAWKPGEGQLIDNLPVSYDDTTMKTIEQIDVLWLKKRSIARAFEVEQTTSVYSGLLRMADLVALQPNINIRLHIVAPDVKKEKVFQEIKRPVFSLLEGRTLAEMCTFLSYSSIEEINGLEHLGHLSDKVLEDFEEKADEDE